MAYIFIYLNSFSFYFIYLDTYLIRVVLEIYF